MPINLDVDREDKERFASLVGRLVNGILLAVVVVLITPGRIGAGIQALWNIYLQALGAVTTGLGLGLQWLATWYNGHRRRILFFGVYLPLASWVFGAWIGGLSGRVIVALGSVGAIAISNLVPLVLRLLARGGQLLVEMVQRPVGAGIKGLVGVLRSISPESFEEKDGEIVFVDTERLVAEVSAADILPLTVATASFWQVLFPSFTTLFGCVLILFGGLALIHMGGLWSFETRWGKRALFRLTKTALALAIAGLFYAAVFPKSAEWIWTGSGKVDTVMVECISDVGECAAGPFRKRSVSPIVAMQAPRALHAADSACRWRISQLEAQFNLGGMKFADYSSRLARITRSCEGDRRSVSATVRSDWSFSDRAVAFLPFLGWLAFLGLAVFFIKGAARVRARRRRRQVVADTEAAPTPAAAPTAASPVKEDRSKWRWGWIVALVALAVLAVAIIRYRQDLVHWMRLEKAQQTETTPAPQTTVPPQSPAPSSTPSYGGSGRTAVSLGAHDSVGLRELDELDRRDRERRERYTWLAEPGVSR